MAEEKLGTLQYDMLVDQKKLEQQLDDITKKLQEKDKQWKEILSGQGNIVSPKINVADLGNLTKANEAIANSTKDVTKSNVDVATSMALLEKEIKAETLALKALSDQELKSTTNQAKLAELQKKIDLYAQFKESLNEEVKARKAQESADKRKADSDEREIKRIQKLTEAQALYRSKLTATVTSTATGTTENLVAQKAVLVFDKKNATDPAEIARLTQAIRENDIARKKLVVTQKEQEASTRRLWQEQKLQAAVDNQSASQIERLRAQYALLKFQLSQVKFSDPNAVANAQKLQSAISGVKSEIQALQPTLGIWGKLTSAIRTYATAYLSVQAVLGLGRAVYGQTKELDSLNFSMKTVIKSSTELAQTQKFLSEVAVNYGGDLLTLSERYIKFRAAAVQSNMSAGETQKIFESVSKAAGTLGLKTDELSGVYLALEQMISKGKVTTEELRRQLGERLPGAFGIMANALGVTIPELDKLLKKGEILSTVALPKFAAALEKAYGIESLTKIDTLAAAQGRLSTEFTGLIKSLQASDSFKNVINSLASFIGLIKDNIGAISLFAKAIMTVTLAVAANRTATALFVGIQKLSVILTGSQIAKMTQLTSAQLASAEATWVNVRATSALSNTFKTFGGWVSIVVNALVGIAAYFLIFNKQTKETADAMSQLNKELDNQRAVITGAKNTLNDAAKGTEQYKEALQQLNTIALKYNQTLLTEKSTRDEVNVSAQKTLDNLDDEYLRKKKIVELDVAQQNVDKATEKVREKLFEYFKDIPGGAAKASLAYKEFIQQVADGSVTLLDLPNTVTKTFGKVTGEAIKAIVKFNEEKRRIESVYPADLIVTPPFDLSSIDKAKKDFEELAKLKQAQGDPSLISSSFISESAQTFEQWVRNQIKSLSTSTASIEKNKDALVALYVALADFDKKQQPSEDRQARLLEKRNEAIKRLNDKYLVDQEDFANYEMGIQSTRIANMEDGLDKEKKLNDLAYERRIAAIEKEKIATLKLLNEAAGIRVGSKEEIKTLDATGYSKDVQDQVAKAREADLTKRKNAENDLRESNLKSEKDYALKIREIRRDVNDAFLSGIEKERAAINEKYDDWARKAKDNAETLNEIDRARLIATTDLNIDAAVDRLKFEEEIEHKKNEIRNFGDKNRRKREAEDFAIYKRTQLRIADALRGKGTDEERNKGLIIEQNLAYDEQLFKLQQMAELRGQIISGAKELAGILADHLGLSQQEAAVLNGMSDVFTNLISGNYVGAAVGALGTVFNILSGTKKEDATTKALEHINNLLQTQSAILSNLSGANYFELSKKQLDDYNKAIDLNTKKLQESKLFTTKEWSDLQAEFKQWQKDFPNPQLKFETWVANQWSETNGWTAQDFIDAYTKGTVALDDQQIEWINEVLKNQKARAELLQETFRTALGFDANSVSDEIMQGIEDGLKLGADNSLGDFSSMFGTSIKKALIKGVTEALSLSLTGGFLQKLTDALSPTSPGGEKITKEEADAAAVDYYNSVKEATANQNEVNKFLKDYGINIDDASSASISKGIQALTEDTGRRLEGLINSIRESGVINIGNTKQLVESSQMIQGYAAQNLAELKMVNTNLATQIGIFNDWTTTTNGTGGKGIKVYVQ